MNHLSKSSYLRFSFIPQMEEETTKWTVAKIRESIRGQILSKLHDNEGMKLPPVRVLAHQLFVSKNTIQEVYEELKSEGLIESRPRQGLYVIIPDRYQESLSNTKEASVQTLESLVAKGELCFPQIEGYTKKINKINLKDLQLGQIHIDPRLIPKQLLSRCLSSISKGHAFPHHVDPQGYLPLREVIAKRLNLKGIEAKAQHIIMTNGTQEALDLFSRLLIPNKRKIGLEDPTYQTGKKLLHFNGVDLLSLPLNPFTGIDLQRWEEKIAQEGPSWLYLTPNFHNPTGYSYTTREMKELMNLSKKYNLGIIEDDWGADILSYSEFKPGFRNLGGDRVLYTNSFTKKLLPSLRVGYLLANEESIDHFIEARSISSVSQSSVAEILLFEFLERGLYDNHLNLLHAELDKRYKNTIHLLTNLMPSFVKFSYPGGGPRIWLNFPFDYDLHGLKKRLSLQGVDISLEDGIFNHQEAGLHGFPIGHAFLNEDEMSQSLKILSQSL